MTTVIVTQPIAKLYKRCAWGKHDQCPGSFQSWSVCSCPCHKPAAGVIEPKKFHLSAKTSTGIMRLAAKRKAESLTAAEEAEKRLSYAAQARAA